MKCMKMFEMKGGEKRCAFGHPQIGPVTMNPVQSNRTERTSSMSPTELAKAAGVRPQVIYNLVRQGYLPAEKVEVKIVRMEIPDDAAQKYLQKRADRQAKKA